MVVALTTTNELAATPPKLTALASVKSVPVMVTVSVLAAEVGVKAEIDGAGIKVNPESVAVPPGAVTSTSPEAPVPTTAVMVVALTTVNEVAATPPKLTALASVKSVPVMVTVSVLAAEIGVKEEMVGAERKINPGSVAIPPGVTTSTSPDAPAPTTAVMVVALTTVKELAATPPKLTALASVKSVPVMVTFWASAAEVGVKEEIDGAGIKVNPPSTAVPKGVVTSTSPVAPAPTIAVIVVALTTVKELAATPPKLTSVAPVKLSPVIVMVSPLAVEVGLNEKILGRQFNPASLIVQL